MKLKKCVGLLIGAAVMLTGCMGTSADEELTPQEKELKAVRSWFENDMTYEDEFSDLTDYAQGMIDAIMGVLGPGVIALGSLVAVVGGIQTGVGFKDDNADGKTRGFQTLIGGAIIAAVGAIIPASLSIGGN